MSSVVSELDQVWTLETAQPGTYWSLLVSTGLDPKSVTLVRKWRSGQNNK